MQVSKWEPRKINTIERLYFEDPKELTGREEAALHMAARVKRTAPTVQLKERTEVSLRPLLIICEECEHKDLLATLLLTFSKVCMFTNASGWILRSV